MAVCFAIIFLTKEGIRPATSMQMTYFMVQEPSSGFGFMLVIETTFLAISHLPIK